MFMDAYFLVDQFNILCYQIIRAVSTHSRKRQIDDEWKEKKDDRIYNLIFKLVERGVNSNQI